MLGNQPALFHVEDLNKNQLNNRESQDIFKGCFEEKGGTKLQKLTKGPLNTELIADKRNKFTMPNKMYMTCNNQKFRPMPLKTPMVGDLEEIYLNKTNQNFGNQQKFRGTHRQKAERKNSFNLTPQATLGEKSLCEKGPAKLKHIYFTHCDEMPEEKCFSNHCNSIFTQDIFQKTIRKLKDFKKAG